MSVVEFSCYICDGVLKNTHQNYDGSEYCNECDKCGLMEEFSCGAYHTIIDGEEYEDINEYLKIQGVIR